MPRVFAHAHLGALDTFLSLFWTLALVAGDRALRVTATQCGHGRSGCAVGPRSFDQDSCLVLAADPVHLVVRLPPAPAGGLAMLNWTVAGISVFWLGWPWLWYDSWSRLQAYLGTGVVRSTIMVQYFGQVVADRDVPWHYPWFYFACDRADRLAGAGRVGLARGWHGRRADLFPLLLAGTIAVFLGIFSTRVPVYDGERLFLHVFPASAMLMGLGFGWLWEQRLNECPRPGRARVLLLVQAYGVIALHPFGLSYYNGLVGGLPGAERLGLELTYWNDAGRSGAARPAGARRRAWRIGRAGPHALSRSRNPDDKPCAGPSGHHPERRARGHPGRVACRFPPHCVLASGDQRATPARGGAKGGDAFTTRSLDRCALAFSGRQLDASRSTRRPTAIPPHVPAPKIQSLNPFLSRDLRNLAPSH